MISPIRYFQLIPSGSFLSDGVNGMAERILFYYYVKGVLSSTITWAAF